MVSRFYGSSTKKIIVTNENFIEVDQKDFKITIERMRRKFSYGTKRTGLTLVGRPHFHFSPMRTVFPAAVLCNALILYLSQQHVYIYRS